VSKAASAVAPPPPGGSRFPFLDHIGLVVREHGAGSSTCVLTVQPFHRNSSGLVHGAVLFALADTGMGAALYPTLEEGDACATIELKISYFKPVHEGELVCTSTLVHRARTVAHLESSIHLDGTLVARASGHFAVVRPALHVDRHSRRS
jgi:acyl-CoA thioesterase